MLEKIKQKLDEFQEAMNLKKKFPNYFNKWIFRGVIVAMIIFTILVFASEGTLKFTYAECNKDTPCNNPFYICPEEMDLTNPMLQEDCMPIESVPKELKPLCDTGVCFNKTLEPHQVIGHKPNAFGLWYNQICLLFVALGFLLNHIKYKQSCHKNVGLKDNKNKEKN
jgi:hypothetical protein